MNTIPLALQYSASFGMNPSPGTMKPPSPCWGSISTHASFSAPTCLSIMVIAASAHRGPQVWYDSPVGQRYG